MTISTTHIRNQYTGTGANTSLAATFPFDASSEIKVTSRVILTGVETVLTETTHYTVAGGSGATGTVTPVDGATDFPSTVEWTLERVTPLTQGTDYEENDAFPASAHEEALDKLTRQNQEQSDQLDRALTAPASDDIGLDMTLPDSVDRAENYLGFDDDGLPVALGAPADTTEVTPFMATVLLDETAADARATLEAQEDVISARGDVVRGSSAGVAEQLPLGAEGRVLTSFASDAAWRTAPLPRSYLAGLTMSNGTDAAHEIDVAVGECRDSTNTRSIVQAIAALTKDIELTWSAGDAGGLLNDNDFSDGASAPEANQWYHIFALTSADESTVDIGSDKLRTGANLLLDAAVIAAGLTRIRRIGSILTDASKNILAFTQYGDRFLWAVPVLDFTDASGGQTWTTAVTIDLTEVPPGGHTVGLLRCMIDTATGAEEEFIFTPMVETDAAPDITQSPLASIVVQVANGANGFDLEIDIDEQRQIRGRSASDAAIDVDIVTRGYIDRRGRDD